MVKSEVIKARIKAKWPTLNLSNERLDALADKLSKLPADDATEADIDAVIDNFNNVMPLADIAKEDDRLRNLEQKVNSTKTPEQIQKEKDAELAKQKAQEEANKAQKEMPEWAKTVFGNITDELKTLKSDLAEARKAQTTTTKAQEASKLFEGSEVLKKLPEALHGTWLKRLDVNSETPIADQIKGLEAEVEALNLVPAEQQQQTRTAGAPPKSNTNQGDKPSDAEISEIAGSF